MTRDRDYYAWKSSEALQEINKRQRLNDERARNGGYTDNEVTIGWAVRSFRRLGVVGRLVVVLVVLVVLWLFLGQGIINAIHMAHNN